MKLKEKWAKEYSEKINIGWSPVDESYKAYLAGFNKAKLMAEGEINMDIMGVHHMDILNLGEKEL